LWPSAAEVVREYGVFRTSKVLHLEYGKLERLAKAAAASRRPAAPANSVGADVTVGGALWARSLGVSD